jgi:hypothetical protein
MDLLPQQPLESGRLVPTMASFVVEVGPQPYVSSHLSEGPHREPLRMAVGLFIAARMAQTASLWLRLLEPSTLLLSVTAQLCAFTL